MASPEQRGYPPLVGQTPEFLVFSDDWGRWPSSSQHLFREIGKEHRVLWVESLGMRPPRLSWADLQRTGEKLRSWSGSKPATPWTEAPEGLIRFCPPMHPWFGSKLGNRSNDALLGRAVRRKLKSIQMDNPLLVTTLPITAGLVGQLGERSSLYYRVDDFALWPGYPSRMLQERERLLLRRANGLLVSAQTLRREEFRGPQEVLDHGVDVHHFTGSDSHDKTGIPASLAAVRDDRPLLLFAGRIDERIDTSLLSELPGQVVLLGRRTVGRLPSEVRVLPPVPYKELPQWLSAADVLLLPYAQNALTETIQPLKLREYMATGRPIVSTPLPEVIRAGGDLIETGAGPESFAEACHRALEEDSSRAALRRQATVAHSWRARAAKMVSFSLQLSQSQSPDH